VISQLGQQLTRRRHAYALHPAGVVAEQQLGCIATETIEVSCPLRPIRSPPSGGESMRESRPPCRH
jgi:hypothetical protein